MNVDLVRAFEAEPVESPRERKGGKGTGFSALMDAVLGPQAEGRDDTRKSAGAKAEEAPRGGALREPSPAPRKAVRDERGEMEKVSSGEAASASEAARLEEVVAAETEAEETAPEGAGEAELASAATAEGVVLPSVPAWEVAAPIAVPGLELLARAGANVENEAAEIVDEGIAAAAAGDAGADEAVFDARTATPAVEAEQDLAEATLGRSVIADPAVRKEFLAALEQARSGEEREDGEAAEAAMPAAAESSDALERAPISERNASIGMRVAARADEPRRSESEVAVVEENGIPKEAARPQGDLGSGGFAREQRGEGRQAAVTPVEQTAGDANAAAPSAATAATTAHESASATSVPEPVLRSDDASTQPRVDAPTPVAPARALELPPALQSGRPSPTAAPDAIAIQADWLATRGGGTARLVLNPPELGEIAIRVTVRQQSVEVVMIAQTALAHAMAEDQGDRLSQAFANRDLRLDQFEVRRGDPSDSSGTGQFGSSDAGARERERAQGDRGVEQGGAGGRGLRRRGAGGEGAGAPPRIVSSGHAAGVDLRI